MAIQKTPTQYVVPNRSDQNNRCRYVQGGTTESFPTRIGWWEREVFPSSVEDVVITLTARYNKRPDLLAADAYGSSTLMWFVLQYNNIVDINTEFLEGATIILPPAKSLQAGLTRRSKV